MASLDVLDYLQGLDAALAKRGIAPAYRRQALKDTRRVIDAMAFRFALMDERPLPEDLDYMRAIEAVKPAERAAPVLERQVPRYRKVRGRRLITTGVVLLVLAGLVGGLAWLATSEESAPLASVSHAVNDGANTALLRNFTVAENMTRLRVEGTIFIGAGNEGNIEIFVRDANGETRLFKGYAQRGTYYLRENILDPAPGEWSVLVDFNGARGSLSLDVSGVSPTR